MGGQNLMKAYNNTHKCIMRYNKMLILPPHQGQVVSVKVLSKFHGCNLLFRKKQNQYLNPAKMEWLDWWKCWSFNLSNCVIVLDRQRTFGKFFGLFPYGLRKSHYVNESLAEAWVGRGGSFRTRKKNSAIILGWQSIFSYQSRCLECGIMRRGCWSKNTWLITMIRCFHSTAQSHLSVAPLVFLQH